MRNPHKNKGKVTQMVVNGIQDLETTESLGETNKHLHYLQHK